MDVIPPDYDLWGNDRSKDKDGILDGRFGVVPFSVLSARDGAWMRRKRAWINLGIKGEEGRQPEPDAFYENNAERCGGHGLSESQERLNRLKPRDAGRCFGQDLMKGEHILGTSSVAADKGYGFAGAENAGLDEKTQRALGVYAATNGAVQERAGGVAGTSVFDPVLCEMMYRWFMPPGGSILDPFAGESTKGIVASYHGYEYTGVELRQGQVDTNNAQALKVAAKVKDDPRRTTEMEVMPKWIQGDSSKLSEVLDNNDPFAMYDFIWTSPPYYDLEIYSASEKDGSAFETYQKFIGWYKDIFAQAVARLKENRFLAVKVGEIRDDSPSGFYRNFEWDNIRVFEELGLRHYNRIVLLSPVGSLPVRIASQFPTYRKVGNTHQMVYLFWKGPKSTKCLPEEFGTLAKETISE